ncbi:hypothetical protein [Pseudomonas fluorescens]|uniref:Uncharacterized protein n=1 Tax=Pseudomonas fluorescens TaxID=294 RepID=A0A5E7A910_PSEFL|nr:hypothetical protein [Pseudomonas fluorescens]VVN75568.1 hypothetical protein PS833_00710 [Pseudomonas fluorescens]
MEHEIRTGLIVTQVGLVKTDDEVFGARAADIIELYQRLQPDQTAQKTKALVMTGIRWG